MALDPNCIMCKQLIELGKFEKRTEWYYLDSKGRFTIMQCDSCDGILIAFNSHDEPSDWVLEEAMAKAKAVVEDLYPKETFEPDYNRKCVPTHPHLHLRRRSDGT